MYLSPQANAREFRKNCCFISFLKKYGLLSGRSALFLLPPPMILSLQRIAVATVLAANLVSGSAGATTGGGERTCLVLADGYVSEYAWGAYTEVSFPLNHPGHDACIRGLLQWPARFNRWLHGWNVKRIDLERHHGPLPFDGVDLVILDDVRQRVCGPYEPMLEQFVRSGGGLLVYGGQWGLGGCPKTEFNALKEVSSYQHSPLGRLLPVEIVATPDLAMLAKEAARRPVFLDKALGESIESAGWQVFGMHRCKAVGEVLAKLDGKPLVCRHRLKQGTVVVYTGDDLGWVRLGTNSNINPFSGTLWRRLAAMAIGDTNHIAAVADPVPTLERTPAFAHPDQPMNFLWTGYFYHRSPEMDLYWTRDLVTHSATVSNAARPEGSRPQALVDAGVLGWGEFGCPLETGGSGEDQSTGRVDSEGRTVGGIPCFNNPRALQKMDEAVARKAADLAASPWVRYGHMGDETQFGNCYCKHCQKAFREEFGYELPQVKDDFSAAYLDRWIDYCLFKNRAIGKMYARAAQIAHQENPGIKMFASLPQSGGMAHGDDQFNTQSGFDLLWDHSYPGTMVIRVGFNAGVLEETAVLQGRPYVPTLNLLQGFDSYDRYPRMPPPEYIREMTWQAIGHGVDSVGWFVYNAFWWNMPGSEAWEEVGRLAREVLEPLTPTLYQMQNAPAQVGLLYCYSQESVDGLKELTWQKDHPWKNVIRWWSLHATHEAYEVLKYGHVPLNVVSEHRLLQGGVLPWKIIVIPYVEHLHRRSREAIESFVAGGGIVYIGANSTLDLPGVKKLPFSFNVKFNTWWPKDRPDEWNQRRVRTYVIEPILEKARKMQTILASFLEDAAVTVEDPEVVCNLREAGVAKYLFFINDHQMNPVSEEFRKKRQRYNHFMLMPMEFPRARTAATVKGPGYLYPLLQGSHAPLKLKADERANLELDLNGGEGKVFLLVPERLVEVEFISPPARSAQNVSVKVRVLGHSGIMKASLPLRIDMICGRVNQTVYNTTKDGLMNWEIPFLKKFPEGTISVTVTELASGKSCQRETRTGPHE